MITFFTTAKAFKGHTGIIQRNALKSWTIVHPDVEVILFGDDEGAADVCREFDIRHEPQVERHESGMKYLHSMFARASQIARHEYLCYSNCDIVLMDDFWRSVELSMHWRKRFLLIGHRWDTDVTEPIAFDDPMWAANLRNFALKNGRRQMHTFIDYFTFNKDLFCGMPPVVIGRSYWDQWLVWKARDAGVPVIDCSSFAVAVHQNHDYGYHPGGKAGTHEDAVAMRNLELSGGPSHQRDLTACTQSISASGRIEGTLVRRVLYSKPGHALWKLAVHDSLALRQHLGLRKEPLRRFADKMRHLMSARHRQP